MATMKWLGQLRTWEDVAIISLGVVAAAAPWILHPAPGASLITLNALIVGLVIAGLATLDLLLPPHWEEPFELLAGAWLMCSPVWLGYSGTLATGHVVIGAIVIVLAAIEFWQDRKAPGA